MLADLATRCRIGKMNSQHFSMDLVTPECAKVNSPVAQVLRFSNQIRLGRFPALMNSGRVTPGCSCRGDKNGKKPRKDSSSDRE